MPDPTLLWKEYSNNRKIETKRKIMEQYIGLVRYVIKRLNMIAPDLLDERDLMNIGMLGLSEAIDRFDYKKGVKFETYAIPRVKGMILDELRKIDWAPRSVREKSKQLKEIIHQLENELGREVSPTEILKNLQVTEKEYGELNNAINNSVIVSLDKPLSGEVNGNLYDMISSDEIDDPFEQTNTTQMKEILIEAIEKLPEKQRLVIALYYYEELTFKEIGNLLKVSESRVSQIHSEVLQKLRQDIRI
jgi:RNA polymerase sigma factor for flagellar operon FliA